MKPYSLLACTVVLLPSCGHAQNNQGKGVTPVPIGDRETLYVQPGAAQGDGSTARPFGTIGEAIRKAAAGDTILLRSGTYRETVRLKSGAPGAPLTLKADAGARPVISGAEPITGWQPFKDKIYVTTVKWNPKDLLVNYTRQPMSQEPNEGWYTVQNAHGAVISDTKNLANRTDDLVGGHTQFFQRKGITFYSKPIQAQDKAGGNFTIGEADRTQLAAGDGYIIKNKLSLLDQPGEWAVEPAGEGAWKLYFWPNSAADLANTQAPQREGNIVGLRNVQHVRLEGLEVTGSNGNGIEVGGSSDVTITRCITHNNNGIGISVRGIKNSVISRNLSLHNFVGIWAGTARDVTIEENEVGFNRMDGVVVAGDVSGRYGKPGADENLTTDGVLVRRNYIHHHILFGHPDNMQLYRGVKNIKIAENLLLGGGQGLMTEEVQSAELQGNVFISSAANLIIFGHGNSDDWKVNRNTFGLPGYGIYAFSGKNYDVRENIHLAGLQVNADTYQGDNNLYQGPLRIQKVTGQETKSVQNTPALLTNVPRSQAIVKNKPHTEDTADTLELRFAKGDQPWQVGETVEVNWDGVARKITEVTGDKVSFTPALPAKPNSNFVMVINWGNARDIKLDVRPTAESPVHKLGAQGNAIGATIDVAAFQRGDFDADGKRDLPVLPADIEASLPNPNKLILPSY